MRLPDEHLKCHILHATTQAFDYLQRTEYLKAEPQSKSARCLGAVYASRAWPAAQCWCRIVWKHTQELIDSSYADLATTQL